MAAHELEGLASWYGDPYHGRRAANGEIYDKNRFTAAHRTLPFETMVRVTNKKNGREVEVRINDRGPFVDGRVIDLSYAAAKKIDMIGPGVVPVKLRVLNSNGNRAGELYSVQVGAFQDLRVAEELRLHLSRDYPAVSIHSFSGQRTIYRVWVGRESLKGAERLASKLRKENFHPFIVRVN